MIRQHFESEEYREPSDVFRLMDLPVELRVMIAKHVLTYDRGLEWRWTKGQNRKRVCALQSLEFIPLARTMLPIGFVSLVNFGKKQRALELA
jgi:hypothetical protein